MVIVIVVYAVKVVIYLKFEAHPLDARRATDIFESGAPVVAASGP